MPDTRGLAQIAKDTRTRENIAIDELETAIAELKETQKRLQVLLSESKLHHETWKNPQNVTEAATEAWTTTHKKLKSQIFMLNSTLDGKRYKVEQAAMKVYGLLNKYRVV